MLVGTDDPNQALVSIALIAAVGGAVTAAITGLFGYFASRKAHKAAALSQEDIEEIRRQVLPDNGTKLWEYAKESATEATLARQASLDALALGNEAVSIARDVKFEQKRHLGLYVHDRVDLEPTSHRRDSEPEEHKHQRGRRRTDKGEKGA